MSFSFPYFVTSIIILRLKIDFLITTVTYYTLDYIYDIISTSRTLLHFSGRTFEPTCEKSEVWTLIVDFEIANHNCPSHFVCWPRFQRFLPSKYCYLPLYLTYDNLVHILFHRIHWLWQYHAKIIVFYVVGMWRCRFRSVLSFLLMHNCTSEPEYYLDTSVISPISLFMPQFIFTTPALLGSFVPLLLF